MPAATGGEIRLSGMLPDIPVFVDATSMHGKASVRQVYRPRIVCMAAQDKLAGSGFHGIRLVAEGVDGVFLKSC